MGIEEKSKVFATETEELIKKGITSSLQDVSGARSEKSRNIKKKRGKSSAVPSEQSNHLGQKESKN